MFFFTTRTIQFAKRSFLILLVLIRVNCKIEMILKILSALDEITQFCFMKFIELNSQKRNLNVMIQCASIFLYLYYSQCKLWKKCKIEVISLFVFA